MTVEQKRQNAAKASEANFRALLPLLAQHKGALTLAAGLSLLAAVVTLAQPLLVSSLISRVQQAQPLGSLVAILVALLLFGSLLGAGQQYLLGRTGEGLVLTTRRSLIGHLLRLPVAEYDKRRTGDLMSRVSTDTTLLRAVITGGLVDAVASGLTVIGAIAAMALVDLPLLGVTLAAVAVGVSAGVIVAKRVRRLTLASQERVGEMSAAIERALSAVRTIRAAGATQREADSIAGSAKAAFQAGVRAVKVEAAVWPLVGVAVQGAFLAVLGFGGYRVARGDIGIEDLIAFILYVFMLVMPLGGLLNAFTQLQMGLGALTRIEEILGVPAEADAPLTANGVAYPAISDNGATPLLELDRVSFAYADGTQVLNEVSLAVPRGSTTALVGPSGAGKSTLLALVARFYDASDGTVKLDGVDVAQLTRSAVRARLGYVEQEAPVLAGTLRSNVILGVPGASDDQAREVLGQVRLTGLLDREREGPAGLDAQVGQDGVMLSGGERQRLAIARALLTAPDLLLLDEPTASLDARNEAALRDTLAAAGADRTVLVIAHRLSTVVNADQIIVLDAGRVVGRGTHAQLLESSPLYRELAETQLLAGEVS